MVYLCFLVFFFGIGHLIVGPFLQNNFVSILLFSSSLAFMDYLRAKILSGFPWNSWAYTWSWKPEILQPLFYTGFFSFRKLPILIFVSQLPFSFCFCLPISKYLKQYLYLQPNSKYMVDTNIRSANTNISLTLSAKYISWPTFWSNPYHQGSRKYTYTIDRRNGFKVLFLEK